MTDDTKLQEIKTAELIQLNTASAVYANKLYVSVMEDGLYRLVFCEGYIDGDNTSINVRSSMLISKEFLFHVHNTIQQVLMLGHKATSEGN